MRTPKVREPRVGVTAMSVSLCALGLWACGGHEDASTNATGQLSGDSSATASSGGAPSGSSTAGTGGSSATSSGGAGGNGGAGAGSTSSGGGLGTGGGQGVGGGSGAGEQGGGSNQGGGEPGSGGAGNGEGGGGMGQGGGSQVTCGNGVVDGIEDCDDSNTLPGDGCGADCTPETGFDCDGTPSVCTCDDGVACDDGDSCTTSDICSLNQCIGLNPIVCAVADDCHQPGVCNTETDSCDFAEKANGTTCASGYCYNGSCLTSTLSIRVFDQTGFPIVGATAIIGQTTVTVDVNGTANFSNVAPGRVVARILAKAYAPATAVGAVQPGSDLEVVSHLLPLGEPIPFQTASGADVVKDNVRVIIPADAVVDSNGQSVNGNVQVTITPLDPVKDISAMPGPLAGIPVGAVNPVPLASLFMADVTLWKGNQELKLKPGKKITLEFLLPDSMQMFYAIGDSIPSWSYDLTQGVWVQEKMGSIINSAAEPGKLAWTADVQHLTWWNADYAPEENCIRVTVLSAANDIPIQNATVHIVPQNYDSSYDFLGTTDADGHADWDSHYYAYLGTIDYCLPMMHTGIVNIKATHPAYAGIVKYDLGSNGNDIIDGSLPTIVGNGQANSCIDDNPTCHFITVYLGDMTCAQLHVDDINNGLEMPGATVTARYETAQGMISDTFTALSNDSVYKVRVPSGVSFTVQASKQTATGYKSDEKLITPPMGVAFPPIPPGVSCTDQGAMSFDFQDSSYHLAPDCSLLGGPCAQWAGIYGNGGAQYVTGIAYDANNNAYLTGYFNGTLTGLGNAPLSSGGDDIFVAKFKSDGTVDWVKTFGGLGSDRATAIAVDRLGNPAIVGHFSGSLAFGASNFTATGPFDGFAVKLSGVKDVNGNVAVIWANQLRGSGSQRPLDIALRRMDPINEGLDEFVVAGYFDTQIDLCSGGPCPLSAIGVEDMFVAMFAAPGGSYTGWLYANGSVGNTARVSGVATRDFTGDMYFTGNFSGTLNFFGVPTSAYGDGKADAFVTRFGFWARTFGLQDDQFGTAIAVDNNNVGAPTAGDVWFTGKMSGSIILTPTNGFSGVQTTFGTPPDTDAFIAKLDKNNGNVLWDDVIGDVFAQAGSDIGINSDGEIIAVGAKRGTQVYYFGGNVPVPVFGTEDIYAVKLRTTSSAVMPVWNKTLGGSVGSYAPNPKLAIAPAAGSILIGATVIGNINFGGIMLTPGGGADVVIGKLLDIQ